MMREHERSLVGCYFSVCNNDTVHLYLQEHSFVLTVSKNTDSFTGNWEVFASDWEPYGELRDPSACQFHFASDYSKLTFLNVPAPLVGKCASDVKFTRLLFGP